MHKLQLSAVKSWYESNPGGCVPKCFSSPCPFCHELHSFSVQIPNNWDRKPDSAHAIAECPGCSGKIDIWAFRYKKIPRSECIKEIELYIFPVPMIGTAFTARLREISPYGCDIFCESERAESEGMQHLAGVGYRKALEFTVKDYLIHLKPDEADEIKKGSLAEAIKMINNENIRNYANGVRILGNEETHYERRVQVSDVDALKKLLHATLKHLDSELYSASLAKDILGQKGKS